MFFFKHPRDRFRNMPGRYPYRVRAAALTHDGESYVRTEACERILYADGYGPDATPSNVDPNVFAEHLPWFLTYCLLGGKPKHRVLDLGTSRPLRGPLSHVAAAGDVILFGWPTSDRSIAVDTVLCVGACIPVPVHATHGKRFYFAFKEDFAVYRGRVAAHVRSFGNVSWERFTASDDFRLNVVDALGEDDARAILGYSRETHHKRTDVLNHMQIIGRSGTPPPRIQTAFLISEFVAGRGFNFIPTVAARSVHGEGLARTHPGLLEIRTEAKHRLPSGGVSRLGDALGAELVGSIFETADALVFGRVEWIARSRFVSAVKPPLRGAP